MYRPEGWDKTLREILDSFNVTYMNSEECKLIEAGADAMLEGLKREKGAYVCSIDADTIKILKGDATKGGYLVFIPEEE